jgi:capsular exopolysaccharide synthesis family protein
MGKTHEAREWAEKEYGEGLWGTSPEQQKVRVEQPPRRASNKAVMERYEDLKTNLFTRHPRKSIKTILFAGTTHGDGSSTTAVNFATTLAKNCQLKVLLVDVNLRTPSLHGVFSIDHVPGLSDLLSSRGEVTFRLKKVGSGNLYVFPCGGNHSGPVGLFESSRFDQFLKTTRESFDYIILDAPPVPAFSEARVICAKVDGVVLVLRSGKTRRQVALKVKKELEEAGGTVLGVVANRKKYYIPEFIYKRL